MWHFYCYIANCCDEIPLYPHRYVLKICKNLVLGDVALHRLTWARVWNLDPPKENVTVTAMAWRPDGKVLAVAYSSGKCLFCYQRKL